MKTLDTDPTSPPPVSPAPAPATDARVFPCDACGGELEFHIGQQRLACPHCGHTREIGVEGKVSERDLLATLAGARKSKSRDEGVATQAFTCHACGGEILFEGTLTSTACAYCGVAVQRDSIHTAADRLTVDGVLAFQVTDRDAQSKLRGWVQGLWFAPNEFRKRGISGGLQGTYLPYWSFDSMVACRYTGQRGDHYYVTVGSGNNKRRERRTRWTSVSGSFQRFFDDVLIPATDSLPQGLLRSLEPWPLQKLTPFRAEHLAGLQARTYEIPLDTGFQRAQVVIREALEQDVCNRIGGDEQRITGLDARHDALSYKHLLLPLYMLAYTYGEKRYRVVVNAGTGEVAGERPYSVWKIAFAVLLGLSIAVPLIYYWVGSSGSSTGSY